MAASEFKFDPSQILVPLFPSALNRLAPAPYGPSLQITRGQAMAKKTSDGKFYPLNTAASDGTQVFGGFAQYSCATDANGVVYLNYGSAASNTFFTPPSSYSNIYTGGVFDPTDLLTAATGTATAEVTTTTPTNPTTGDIYTVTAPNGAQASFTVGATQTAAAVVTGLKNAWNADPYLTGLGAASGTGTFIVTAANAGQPLGLKATAVGTGTVALVITTPAVAAQQNEVDTFTPTNPTTGDVYTITLTYPGAQTVAVSATVGATQTATAIVTLLKAAWAANPQAAAYATATGTTTLILTSATPGSTMNLSGSVVGTGTIAKVVTTPAYGRNIADILPGCPGARVLQPTGAWELP